MISEAQGSAAELAALEQAGLATLETCCADVVARLRLMQLSACNTIQSAKGRDIEAQAALDAVRSKESELLQASVGIVSALESVAEQQARTQVRTTS